MGGREGVLGFMSLERAKVYNLTISGIEVQGPIDDVEEQLANAQRKDMYNEVQKKVQKKVQKEVQKEVQKSDVIEPQGRPVE